MKRFWVFVIITIVALGFGFTIFRFMSKEEILRVESAAFEVNCGENVILDLVKENLKEGTTIDVTITDPSILAETGEEYNYKALRGGSTTLVVSSNMAGFTPIMVQVTVGDGNYATPFFIKNQEQLAGIGVTTSENGEGLIFPLSSSYKLVSDINLIGTWTPIGSATEDGFVGNFDFNGHTIQGLSITEATGNVGLFSLVGETGVVRNAKLKNVSITSGTNAGSLVGVNNGTVEYASVEEINITLGANGVAVGGLVGVNYGNITKSEIKSGNIRSTNTEGVVGGLVGLNSIKENRSANISRSSAICNVTGEKYVGGLVGQSIDSIIENCYAGSLESEAIITVGSTAYAGGIAGQIEAHNAKKSFVADTYAVMRFAQGTANHMGAIIGYNKNQSMLNYSIIYGNYFSRDINGSIAGIAAEENAHDNEGVYGKTNAEMKQISTYFSYEASSGTRYNWQFVEGVWSLTGGNLPKLSYEIPYISTRTDRFTEANSISTYQEFIEILPNADSSSSYMLNSNIDLPTDYEPFEFNGQLTCPVNEETGEPIYSIRLNFNRDASVVNGVMAVFTNVGKNAKLTNIKVIANTNNVTTANHISAIAGYNYGVMENCFAEGSLTVNTTSGTIYFGGLAAENHGIVSGGASRATITYTKSPSMVYVGGIVGYNTNSVQNATNHGAITVEGRGEGYVGGIAGCTNAEILKCANKGAINGTMEAEKMVFAGIVGRVAQSINAKVFYCSSYEEIRGSNVGGVVGVSFGAIKYCYSKATCEGRNVGGLAYAIEQGVENAKSYMSNCMTDDSVLISSGIVCGVTVTIAVSKQNLAYCENIFSSAKFSGSGQKFYESSSNIRGDFDTIPPKSAIDWDCFNHCIHVDRGSGIKRNRFPQEWWKQYPYVGVDDIEISEEEAKGSDGYSIFSSNDYSDTVWLYNNATRGNYIMLKNIAK